MTCLVTVEMLVCVLLTYGLDELLHNVIKIQVKIPLAVEMILASLLIGSLVTSQLSKWFFNPIKKLRKLICTVENLPETGCRFTVILRTK